MDGIELFDATYFGYTPKEAEMIDPQQRLFLEIAVHALSMRAATRSASKAGSACTPAPG